MSFEFPGVVLAAVSAGVVAAFLELTFSHFSKKPELLKFISSFQDTLPVLFWVVLLLDISLSTEFSDFLNGPIDASEFFLNFSTALICYLLIYITIRLGHTSLFVVMKNATKAALRERDGVVHRNNKLEV